MKSKIKVIWNARKPLGTPLEKDGNCVLCNHEISNIENHYASEMKDVKICLTCVAALSESYESAFTQDVPKREREEAQTNAETETRNV